MAGMRSESTDFSLRGLKTDRDLRGPYRGRKRRRAHEIGVGMRSRRSSLGDRPDDERLPAPRVAGHEDTRNRGVKVVLTVDVAAAGELRAQLLLEERALGSCESHRNQHEIRWDLALG